MRSYACKRVESTEDTEANHRGQGDFMSVEKDKRECRLRAVKRGGGICKPVTGITASWGRGHQASPSFPCLRRSWLCAHPDRACRFYPCRICQQSPGAPSSAL